MQAYLLLLYARKKDCKLWFQRKLRSGDEALKYCEQLVYATYFIIFQSGQQRSHNYTPEKIVGFVQFR